MAIKKYVVTASCLDEALAKVKKLRQQEKDSMLVKDMPYEMPSSKALEGFVSDAKDFATRKIADLKNAKDAQGKADELYAATETVKENLNVKELDYDFNRLYKFAGNLHDKQKESKITVAVYATVKKAYLDAAAEYAKIVENAQEYLKKLNRGDKEYKVIDDAIKALNDAIEGSKTAIDAESKKYEAQWNLEKYRSDKEKEASKKSAAIAAAKKTDPATVL